MTFPPGQQPPNDPAADLAAAQAALAAAEADLEDDQSLIDPANNDPAYLRQGLTKAHGESKQKRLKIAEQKKQIVDLQTKAADLERILNDKTKKELEAQGNLQALREMENKENLERITAFQTKLIDTTIEAKMAAAGLPPKLRKLVDLDLVAVDGHGNVTGVDEAISAFKRENSDIVAALKPGQAAAAPAGAPAAAEPPAGKPNPADNMIGVMDMAKVRSLAAAGSAPNPASATPQAKPLDVRKMTKKEKDAAYEKYRSGLATG